MTYIDLVKKGQEIPFPNNYQIKGRLLLRMLGEWAGFSPKVLHYIYRAICYIHTHSFVSNCFAIEKQAKPVGHAISVSVYIWIGDSAWNLEL